MHINLLRWLKPPVFDSEDQTRAARLLHIILLSTTLLNGINMGFLALQGAGVAALNVNLFLTSIQIGMFALMRTGRVKLAGLLFTIFCSLALTYACSNVDGLFNPVFGGQIVVILMGGLTSGGRVAVLLAVLNTVSAFWLLEQAYQNLLIQAIGTITAGQAFVNYALMFIIAGIVIALASRMVQDSLARARQIQQELVESEQRFQLAIKNSPIFTSRQDRDLRFTWSYSAQPLGESILGKTDADVFSSADAGVLIPIKRRILETGTGERHEVSLTFSGVIRHYDLTIEPLLDASSKIVGLSSTGFDITDRKLAEREQTQATILKVELEKERAIADLRAHFLTMVSHHFRTPLSIILTSNDLVERYDAQMPPQVRHEHLEKIAVQVAYMVKMLEDVLTISKARSHNLTVQAVPIEIKSFCSDLIARLPKTECPIALVTSPADAVVYMDETFLEAILFNLLLNATQHTQSGDLITLRVEVQQCQVIFCVEDNGTGIPADEQPHIFAPFYQGKKTLRITKESVLD